jgi:hypothetical protein
MTNQTLIKNTVPRAPVLRSLWRRRMSFIGVCLMWFWITCFILIGLGLVAHAIWFAIQFGWRSFSGLCSLC